MKILYVCFGFLVGSLIIACSKLPFGSKDTRIDEKWGRISALAINAAGEIFAGTEKGYLFRSSDNGEHWNRLPIEKYGINAIAFNARGHIFVASEDEGLFRSTDNGQSFQAINNGDFPPTTFGPHVFAIAADGTLFCGTGYGVYRSKDNGDSWHNVLPDVGILTLVINSDGVIFAGEFPIGTRIFRSDDSGNTWTQAYNLPEENFLRAMLIHPNGDLYIGIESYDNQGNGGKVMRSSDGGATWETVWQAERPVWSMAVTPAGILWAGTQSGIYHSSDGGASWQKSGLDGEWIRELISTKSGEIWAATDSRRLFKSRMNGSGWEAVRFP